MEFDDRQFAAPVLDERLRVASEAARMARVRGQFLDFFEREHLLVIRFLRYLGASLPDAEDAASEAFVAAWERLRDGEFPTQDSQRRSWVRTVARRAWSRPPAMARHQVAVAAGVELPELCEPGPGHAELTDQTMAVLAALGALEENTRVVMAFHLDGFSSVETARAIGVSDQKARDLLKKARAVLRHELSAQRDADRRGRAE
ncbi:sigma-70 family RNA polymerase sigma factor [Kitasatospora sp. NPDC094015]|uniref:sigma-70 family RNA polymerase sigma factor n=1 Tax=Kitasatospora sp. NPDC094015 TaxID=3155205 RepID=UPI00332E14D9